MMSQPIWLSERVQWIGAFDPSMRTFDVILKTPNGTTYNAYAVRGSEGVAVIDTVKIESADQFFARLEAVARYDEIKVIVLNHLEPDHTGALPELMRRAPQAKLYISSSAQLMLKALLNQKDVEFTPVTTGDSVSLGDRTLQFLHTPYLHWPDTQCTYLEEEYILFSGDVFGCHFCDERIFNDKVGDFRFAFEYYYAHIMRPFRVHVTEALALIDQLPINMIAPTHGPIHRDQPQRYIERYRELSHQALQSELHAHEKSLVIFYISAYGSTTLMAKAIRDGIEEIPNVRVSLYDIEGGDADLFVDLVEEADGILIGTPTINGDAAKPAWDVLATFCKTNVKGKLAGAFGSYGWSGEAILMLEDRMRGLKMRIPLDGLRIKLIPSATELENCKNYGRQIAEHLVGIHSPRVIDMADLLAAKQPQSFI
jgi:flavorubredoxin